VTAPTLSERLRLGVIEHLRRWSGDTHDDIGGSVDTDATEALMREAADYIAAQSRTIQLQGNDLDSLRKQIAALLDRSDVRKHDDKCGRVLWHLHNSEVSVGKAAEWMREYIQTGKEGPLPEAPK
jgi:hypothetical protein